MQTKATNQFPISQRLHNFVPFLENKSSFMDQDPISPENYFQALNEFDILVVGAGGLGCQLVKNLALSGIKNIHLIDMDTIDLTNLNRQFLFRKSDIGKYKAEVVGKFIMSRCPGVKVTSYTNKVQQFGIQFYEKFSIILGGLDNVAARLFLNTIVHQINKDSEQTLCYFIDGSTEKLGGQTLVVEPFKTACYACSRKGLQQQPKANFCTIASTPRTPQHCIQYIIQLAWPEKFPNKQYDTDNLQDMQWIYEKSLQRANQHKIEGVTQMLTMGVAKNIIPAVASTNAFIAASCVNQAMKLIANLHPRLDNYFVFFGANTIGGYTMKLMKEQNCEVCQMRAHKIEDLHISISYQAQLKELVQQVTKIESQTIKPYINVGGKLLANPGDEQRYKQKLITTFKQFKQLNIIKNNPEIFIVTDKYLKSELKVIVTFD